ncbi:alpha/beta fold hydrolase [Natronococcus pandeyae]|uniref:alpha/beta fold hydrolase n=1 Tax=Natronococcus pandeyae TaxID=2055836 RepID=UPI001F33CFF7|nr:alpha/beta fold hydrolase [Natronococcus pandeyae]
MGSGSPLVLVHGATVDRRIWERSGVSPALAEHCTVYAMDRRGHGESDDDTTFELDPEIEDVVTVVESIDEPVTLLGHSAGATRSLEAASRTDNLRALCLYEPAIPVGEDAFDFEEEVDEMMRLLDAGENEQAYRLFLDEIAQFTPDELEAFHSAPLWEEYANTFHETLLPRLEAAADYDADLSRFEELTTPTLLRAGGSRR